MKERVLVTGITGFVGSHLADYILENHPDVEIFASKRWHLSRKDNVAHIWDRIHWVDCDLTDPVGALEMIEEVQPHRIFHCAAESFVSPSWKHPSRYMNANYNATVNLLEGLRRTKSEALFHIPGSGEEYGKISVDELPINESTVLRPVNPYAVTKIAQDLIGYVYNQSYGLKVIRTRAFNHEGPRRENVFGIPWYAYQIARIEAGAQDKEILTGHIDDKRNFTHVKDMVRAYWIATDVCEPGELYLIGSEAPSFVATFREALERLIAMSTVEGISHRADERYIRPTNVPYLIADTSKFREVSGWEPRLDLDTILRDTLEFWRERVRLEQQQ